MDRNPDTVVSPEEVSTFYSIIADDAAWCYFDDDPYKVSADEPVPRPIQQEQTQYPVRVDIRYTPDLDIPENPDQRKYAPKMSEADITGRITLDISRDGSRVHLDADVSDSWHHTAESLQEILDDVAPDDPLEGAADRKRIRLSASNLPARSPSTVYSTAADIVDVGRDVVGRLAQQNVESFRQRLNLEEDC